MVEITRWDVPRGHPPEEAEDMKSPIDLNTFFREVTLRICSSLELEKALQKTSEYLKPYFNHDHIGMYYLDPASRGVYTLAMTQTDGKNLEFDKREPVARIHEKYLQEILGKFRGSDDGMDLEIIKDEMLEYYFRICVEINPALPVMDIRSAMILRLRIEDNLIGVLHIESLKPNAFDRNQADLLRSIRHPVALAMSNARRYREVVDLKDRLADDNIHLHRDLERISGTEVVGSEYGLKHVMEMVSQVAPLTSPVLLQGETGAGKEIIANAIHMLSPRRNQPMIRVQCGAIPETLLDSELFGHEKGAFTGASSMKRGRFERAEGGTIFLDEIGELTRDAQVKLLGVLQEREFERLGGTSTLKTDVRVITATHRNLEEMVREGRFREDLWFRLNVFPIFIPPLRQRKEDIPDLIHYFMSRKSREMNLPAHPELATGAMDQLLAYDWPGNVRELQNIIERALILHRGKPLQFHGIGISEPSQISPAVDSQETSVAPMDTIIARHIRKALTLTHGRIKGEGGAAEMLGINPSTLRARMKKMGIPYGRSAS